MKKVVLAVLVLGLFGGGFLYWQKSQADVRELNKTLPEGVKVAKSLFGGEYKIVNKIDGYEFKVPPEWRGVKEASYSSAITEQEYTASSFGIEGNEATGRIAGVDRYKIENNNTPLKSWAETNFATFELVGDFSEDKVGEFDIVKTEENVHLGGMFVYFFKKDNVIYAIVNGSEEFIKYIITNGKW